MSPSQSPFTTPQLVAARHHAPMCQDPEGWGPLSSVRELDLTPCFETGVLLNIPVVLLIITLVYQLVNIKKKGPWQVRSAASKRILKTKLVSCSNRVWSRPN